MTERMDPSSIMRVSACESCLEVFLADEIVCHDNDGRYICETCAAEDDEAEEKAVEVALRDADEFAQQNCKITRPIPRYDPSREFKPSPSEYARGFKEAYTPNSYYCMCRHECTNYDALLKDRNPMNQADQIYVTAIRERINELLEKEGVRAPHDW